MYISIRNICILTHIILHIVIHIYISTPYVDVDTLNSICTASTCVAVPDSELRLLQQLFFASTACLFDYATVQGLLDWFEVELRAHWQFHVHVSENLWISISI